MAIQINGNGTITGISVGGLPDGIVDTDMIAANAVTSAKASGLGGLTMHDTWHISSALDPGNGSIDITGTWARSNSTHGYIGSAMTESSGVFTFPSTGIYYIQIAGGFFRTSSDQHNYTGFNILTCTDGSSFANRQGFYSNLPGQSGTTYSVATASYTFDVTNTSTHKVKFQTVCDGSGTSVMESASRKTSAEFTKLGDT